MLFCCCIGAVSNDQDSESDAQDFMPTAQKTAEALVGWCQLFLTKIPQEATVGADGCSTYSGVCLSGGILSSGNPPHTHTLSITKQ